MKVIRQTVAYRDRYEGRLLLTQTGMKVICQTVAYRDRYEGRLLLTQTGMEVDCCLQRQVRR